MKNDKFLPSDSILLQIFLVVVLFHYFKLYFDWFHTGYFPKEWLRLEIHFLISFICQILLNQYILYIYIYIYIYI